MSQKWQGSGKSGMSGQKPSGKKGGFGMQPGMQQGMQPGMPGMQPGMQGMMPGMMPGMQGTQPGMMPGMQQGMQPGMPGMPNMNGMPPNGPPPQQAPPAFRERSYIENILRLNRGKQATVYMTFENNEEWNARVFHGIIEEAGKDHIVLSDPENETYYLLLMIYLDYITFDQPIDYEYPFNNMDPAPTQE